MALNGYEDVEGIRRSVAEGRHRDVVGGLWEEVGRLQFDFLVANGLERTSRLIDVGCGCFRGGVHFVKYLDDNSYFGIDSNGSLLDAGYGVELKSSGLDKKLPRRNLVCSDEFNFDAFPIIFDFAIAQSLFTHLPLNHVRLCLSRLATKMNRNGKFFATFFLVAEEHPFGQPFTHAHGVTTFDAKDPYHYRFCDVAGLCAGLSWRAALYGAWGHPRDQRMVGFIRTDDNASRNPACA